jgi:ribonuclease R
VTDRRAEEAFREVTGWLKAEFMNRHIGETFTGRVSGVTAFGVFVTLDLFQVDGLVHISELGNDYFHFDPSLMLLVAEHSGHRISLGDAMTVRVAGARPDEGKIDFVPLEPVGGENKARRKRRKSKKR